MGTGVQCVLQRMHNMTAESASGALHSEREMCYSRTIVVQCELRLLQFCCLAMLASGKSTCVNVVACLCVMFNS